MANLPRRCRDMTSTQVYIGSDPDMARPSLAAVDAANGEVVGLFVSRRSATKKGSNSIMHSIRNLHGIFSAFLDDLGHPVVLGVAIEGQQIEYTARTGASPSSILALGTVTGALVSEALHEVSSPDSVLLPVPQAWKGGVPKEIHQGRVLSRLGWQYEKMSGYCVPSVRTESLCSEKINQSDWKHLVDSIGLAVWCRETLMAGKR